MKPILVERAGPVISTQDDRVDEGEFYPDMRIAYDSDDNPIYIGKHLTHKTNTSNTAWLITKFTWASGLCTRKEGPLTGAWDDRASLSWE